MKLNIRSIIISFILNLIIALFLALLNINLGLILIITLLMLFPILANSLSLFFSHKYYSIYTIFIMSFFNTILYLIVANSIMKNPKFETIVNNFSTEKNEFYIRLNQDLVNLQQLFFTFLIYFCLTFLVFKFISRGGHHVKNRKSI
ncbi:Msa family membrane protein [Staphylococcus caeli]|uniref:Msa family membrane protein n=1 Tax=Staphylococcus caeli TaxID=2201815 RepID=UPI003F569AA4